MHFLPIVVVLYNRRWRFSQFHEFGAILPCALDYSVQVDYKACNVQWRFVERFFPALRYFPSTSLSSTPIEPFLSHRNRFQLCFVHSRSYHCTHPSHQLHSSWETNFRLSHASELVYEFAVFIYEHCTKLTQNIAVLNTQIAFSFRLQFRFLCSHVPLVLCETIRRTDITHSRIYTNTLSSGQFDFACSDSRN